MLPSEHAKQIEFPSHSGERGEGFVICYSPEAASMAFCVVRVVGKEESGERLLSLFEGDQELTTEIDKAEPVIEGFIKSNGCADVDIGHGEGYRNHFCGRESAREIGRMLDAIYDVASEEIPTWRG